jgi:hypothetical protein
MPLTVTETTYFRLTTTTFPILPAIFLMYISRLDPLSTAACRTIDAILRSVFLILSIPILLEIDVEQPLYMLEGNVVGGATLWRHVLRVSN